ncbi:MAG: response regulator [Oryzomonas sp.]|uniref:HD-GYP domain-containing protein n=1 Tax=Oryzomonas sp. TaxID=2855186 RepID=UPI00284244F7|nr:HD domain-containing phosphohydrolase [Oryzomonas sp.]MDR3579560.1 response regulator [Oryzomonas sp.]
MNNVLFVDDEPSILRSVERTFHDADLRILTADSGEQALEILGQEKIAVVVSDNRMPGMSGIDLLTRVRTISPDTVRIMMTAFADLETAIAAINTSEVFRFVTKPWNNENLIAVINEGLTRYRVVRELREGDESRYLSIAQAIELKDSYTRGHCDRVANYAVSLSEALGLPETVIREIRFGSWLHDCGKIGVPEAILNYGGRLPVDQFELVKQHPLWGSEVARQARMSRTIVNIILHHHERYDGSGYPAGLRGDHIPIEARIVSIADVFDALHTDRPYRKAYEGAGVLSVMQELTGSSFDPHLMEIFMPIAEKVCA